jgi:hypothetical protein
MDVEEQNRYQSGGESDMNDVEYTIAPPSYRSQCGRADYNECNDTYQTTDDVELFELASKEVRLYVEVEI